MGLTFRLGRTGEKVSAIGLGFWQAGSPSWGGSSHLEEIRKGVLEAVSLGINFFDTAEVYGKGKSESLLGEVLGNNDDVLIASKVAGFRTTVDSILKAAARIKQRLRRDAVDLLQYHWPPSHYSNICRIVRGMEEAIDRGYARYIGLCNFNKRLFEKAMECSRKHELVSNQVQYSLGYRSIEGELKPYLERLGVLIIAWGPLAKGAVVGKRKADNIARKLDPVFHRVSKDRLLADKVREIADRHGVSVSAVALRWLIEKKAFPIPGFTRSFRVREYYDSVREPLTSWEIMELDRLTEKYITLYGSYNPFGFLRFFPSILLQAFYLVSPGF